MVNAIYKLPSKAEDNSPGIPVLGEDRAAFQLQKT